MIWRWRSQLQLTWDKDPWSASITGRYFSPIDEDCSVVVQIAQQLGNPGLVNLCSNPECTISWQSRAGKPVASVTFTDLEVSWRTPPGARA